MDLLKTLHLSGHHHLGEFDTSKAHRELMVSLGWVGGGETPESSHSAGQTEEEYQHLSSPPHIYSLHQLQKSRCFPTKFRKIKPDKETNPQDCAD